MYREGRGRGRAGEDGQQLEAGRRGVWMVIRGVVVGRMREFNLTCLSIQMMQKIWLKQMILQKFQQKIQQKM